MFPDKFKFFDCHVHFNKETNIPDSVKAFEKFFEAGNVEKALFHALPTHFVECAGPTQLVKGLFFKDYFKDKIFAFAGLIHHPELGKEAQSRDFEKQLERYFSVGFDGLKMLEGKPTTRKETGLTLTDPVFERAFSFLEENGISVTLHNADPATFWDLSQMTEHEISRGWFVDSSLPTKNEMFEEIMTVMSRHPKLKLTLAHYGFTSDNIEQARRFLDGYENTRLDMTPGWEQYYNMCKNVREWVPFLESHADRIKYGTDSYNNYFEDEEAQLQEMVRQWIIIRNFYETTGEHDIYGRKYFGIDFDRDLLKNMYYENAAKEYGLTPKPIDKQFVFEEIDKLYPLCTAEERADLDIIAKHFGG